MQEEEHVPEADLEWPNPGPGRIKRFAKYFYNRFLRLRGSPEQIAWGAAVGFFVGMTPTVGIQMYIAVAIAAFFRINKVAAAAAVWISNPATVVPIYGLDYKIGAKILGYTPKAGSLLNPPVETLWDSVWYSLKAGFLSNPSWETFWDSVWLSGKHVVLPTMLGGVLTGIGVGLVGYFVILAMVRTAREKAKFLRREERQLRRKKRQLRRKRKK